MSVPIRVSEKASSWPHFPVEWLPAYDDVESWTDICRGVPGYDPFRNADGYFFCPAHAARACAFFELCLKHTEGAVAGKPFILEPWQRSIVANIMGWLRSDDEYRRYRECLIYVPRKNGKTPLVAGLSLCLMYLDGEQGGQNYCAASDTEQASYLFRHASGMVERNDEMYEISKITRSARSILHDPTRSFLRVISAVAESKHGGNPHFIAIDELHAQSNRELVDVLRTSMASANRKQPLIVYLTTADIIRPSVCNEVYNYACQVRDGLIDDPQFLPVVYEAINGQDDWRDPETWRKANPNLGVSVSEDYLRRECAKAQASPSLINSFCRLHLNMRTEQLDRWLSVEEWNECEVEPLPEHFLRECPCYCGLDLSATQDITAFVACYDVESMDLPYRYYLVGKYWLPARSIELRSQRDRVPYESWRAEGHISVCGSGVIDYDEIGQYLEAFCAANKVREIATDPHNARSFMQSMVNKGIPIVEHPQTARAYNDPCKAFMRLIVSRGLAHAGCPVLRWAVGNLVVVKDQSDNIRPVKNKSFERIDPAVAAIMAVGRADMASTVAEHKSVYDSPDSEGVIWLR